MMYAISIFLVREIGNHLMYLPELKLFIHWMLDRSFADLVFMTVSSVLSFVFQ